MAKKSARRVNRVHKREGLEKLVSEYPHIALWLIIMLLGLVVGYKILPEAESNSPVMYIPIILIVIGTVGFFGSTVSALSKHRK